MTSATYRNASRSWPMSTKDDCIPGRTRVTLPLIDVADDAAVGFPLDEELGDDAVVQERHLGLLGGAC